MKRHPQQVKGFATLLIPICCSVFMLPQLAWSQEARLAIRAASSASSQLTSFTVFSDMPDMACGVATGAGGDLRITFSAEAGTSAGIRMFVRALVDGEPAAPANVVFAYGDGGGTRSFTFTMKDVGAGGHWVKVQWLVDAGGTGYVRDRSLTLLSTSPSAEVVTLAVKAAPSGVIQSTTSPGFLDIPDMTTTLTTAANANIEIRFGGEVYTSSTGTRMFVRALVDGQVALPSDVLFVSGSLTGTRSFTFSKNGLLPGVHEIRVQWAADPSGSAFIGDRTLSVLSSTANSGAGGLTLTTAPSGPLQTTTSSSWVDIPNMLEHITTLQKSDLEIMFGAEAGTSGGQPMALRALVDGQPATPPEAVFADGALTGTRSFAFAKPNLEPGHHTVQIQWRINAGGTASIGDRTLSLLQLPQAIPDLANPYYGMTPRIGSANVLVLLWDAHRPEHPAPSKQQVQSLIFGSEKSVQHYFQENSGGRFSIHNAGVLGWYDSDRQPGSIYWGPYDQEDLNDNGILDPGEDTNGNGTLDKDLDGDGWVTWHQRKWWEAIRNSDATINYKAYDQNNDNILGHDEMVILVVIPQNNPFGTQRSVLSRQYPTPEPVIVDGVRINDVVEAYIGSPPNLGVVAHELAHILLGADDMYVYYFQPYRPGAYSLMDSSPQNPGHLDPFHKLKCGWIEAQLVTHAGWYTIPDVETRHQALILDDPTRDDKEYFIIENRWLKGSRAFTDRDYRYGHVPASLEGSHCILTAVDDKFNSSDTFLRFVAAESVTVYIAHDKAYVNKPAWLSAFQNTGQTLSLRPCEAVLYKRSFAPGPITLGGNVRPGESVNSCMYTVIMPDLQSPNSISALSCESGRPCRLGQLHGGSYDSLALAASGLAVWHIMEDPAVFNALPPPAGVDPNQWNQTGGWGRRAIRMIRPIYGPPINWALWDGADPSVGYDLLSVDANPSHVTLTWADGTPSGYALRSISAAGPEMSAFIQVPSVACGLAARSARTYNLSARGLQNGSLAYTDRTYQYSQVPAFLEGASYIRTANDDKGDSTSAFLSFSLCEDRTVYVAHDDRYAAKPSWLGSFRDTGIDVWIGTVPHSIFRQFFNAGMVNLGGNVRPGETFNGGMYTVILGDSPGIGVQSMTLSGGLLVVRFEGTLCAADKVEGPYQPILDASSPYSIQPTAKQKFYLAK